MRRVGLDLRDPAVLLERIDGADRELRMWFLLVLTWRAMAFALEDKWMSPLLEDGERLEKLREKISSLRKRERASDELFDEAMRGLESHHKVEGAFWELVARFSEEHGFKRGGWGMPPEWR